MEILRIVTRGDARGRSLEIYGLDRVANLCTLVHEIAKVLSRNLALATDLLRFFALGSKLFHGTLQSDAKIISRKAEDFAHRGGYSVTVSMDVVDGGELVGDLGGQTMGKCIGDLVEDIGSSSEG